ncbi:MAG: aspartate aminotransferase family protein, partial [Chitinophagaceae bacterium]
AEGCMLYGTGGEEWIDGIGGISVANVGHRHPAVLEAVRGQLDAYLHVMVYGEFVQSPQVRYAEALAATLPKSLHSVYFTNSGAEAVEGALKLAKRVTGRTGIVAFENSYHGSTQGALSVIGSEYWRNAYRPLLPGIHHARYNDFAMIDRISTDTACVIAETVQAEAGVRPPSKAWLQALRARCTETGTLLILDEIQTGFGRTGSLWAFEQYEVVPDVLLLGKALGGGMPLGAFIASKDLMDHFTDAPVLGHISTFGGHPVCCAAGLAAFEALQKERLPEGAEGKGALFADLLKEVAGLQSLSRCGLWIALRFDSFETNKRVIDRCIEKGLLTDWFLFAADCLRLSPPLTISEGEIRRAAAIIREAALL